MTEYGLIDVNGIMTSKMLESYNEHFKDEDGELKERIVTIEEQSEILSNQGWKPVDLISENQMQADDGYHIDLVPFDNGDRISYRYNIVKDLKSIKDKIQALKKQLSAEDYKITKCYEFSLLKETLPYNIVELHTQRQAIREKINNLEALL